MGDTTHTIDIQGVSRSFGERTVVENVTLKVDAGEVLGLVGPNGGGKSTLLMLVAGLLRPTKGSVNVLGAPAHKLALSQSGTVGLVTARPGLYPLLTGWENLEHFGGLYRLSAADVHQKASTLIASLGLESAMSERVGGWSSGMQQKLSLVRALFLAPRVLLFDEPTANLDPLVSEVLYGELRSRADDGLACVLVTHDLNAAEMVCDRVVLLAKTVRNTMTFDQSAQQTEGPLLKAWKHALEQAP